MSRESFITIIEFKKKENYFFLLVFATACYESAKAIIYLSFSSITHTYSCIIVIFDQFNNFSISTKLKYAL